MLSKTKEQFRRTLERKDDVPKEGDAATLGGGDDTTKTARHPEARQSEFPVSPRRHEPGKPAQQAQRCRPERTQAPGLTRGVP